MDDEEQCTIPFHSQWQGQRWYQVQVTDSINGTWEQPQPVRAWEICKHRPPQGIVHLLLSPWQYERHGLPLGLPLKADRPERTSAPFTLVNELPSLPSSTARARRDLLPILAPLDSLRTRHAYRQWACLHRAVGRGGGDRDVTPKSGINVLGHHTQSRVSG